jgi:hypothetical protein
VVDPTQTNTGDVFDETYLQETAIGAGGRSYQSVLTQSGGVAGGDNPNVLGSTEGENSYLIDGLSTTDPVTSTWSTQFNFDAIQEISFQTGGFEAEYGQATGGIVNVVTKSGSNALEGVFDIRYRDQSFYEGSDDFPPWQPYDPSVDKTSYMNPAVTLGGPLMKDKVWFFVSYQNETGEMTPSGVDYSYKYEGQYYMGKVTWQVSPSDTLIGKYSADPATHHNYNASLSVAEDAAAEQRQTGNVTQMDYSRILSESLLLTAKVGMNRSGLDYVPESGDYTTPPYYFIDTGYSYNNVDNIQTSKRNRDEAMFSLTYFKNNLLGDHTFKFGGDYNNVNFTSQNYTPGGRIYYTLDYVGDGQPHPYERDDHPILPSIETKGKQWNVYIQDEWKILPNLVFKPGLRYDVAQYTNDVGTQVADFKKAQPRIGIAWDIFNDATTVLRGYYGQFMHPSALTLPDILRSQTSTTVYNYSSEFLAYYYGMTPEEVCETFGPCDAEGYINWGEGTSSPFQSQKNLRPTYANQYSIGFERQILPRTSVEVNYVQKRTNDIMEDTCGGYDADGNFIDPYNYINNPDAYDYFSDCQFYIMRNNKFATRYYYGYIFKFESRYKDWFHIMFDYTYSVARESVGYTQNAGADLDLPIHYLNINGYSAMDNTHYAKLNGYFFLPYNFTLGFNTFFRTGRPYNKYADRYSHQGENSYAPPNYGYYNLNKIGTYRLNSVWWMDFQVTWGFKIAEGIEAKLIGSISNITNNQFVLGKCGRWWSTDPNEEGAGDGSCGVLYTDKYPDGYPVNFGSAYAWQTPRSYEVGFRLEF